MSCAITLGFRKCVQLLIDKNADVNYIDDRLGGIPLSYALQRKDTVTIKSLMEAEGFNYTWNDIPDKRGRTALSYAVEYGMEEAVSLLLTFGANPNSKHPFFSTPLSYAIEGGSMPILKMLLSRRAYTDPKSNWPLIEAVAVGRTDIVGLLLEHGADVWRKNINGATPLTIAEVNGK